MNNVLVVKHYQDGRKIEYTVPRLEAYLMWHKIVSDYPDEIVIEDGDSICIYDKYALDRRVRTRTGDDKEVLTIEFSYFISYH